MIKLSIPSLSKLFSAWSYPDRLRPSGLLQQNEDRAVTQRPEVVGISQSLASTHLKLLRHQGIVLERMTGKHVLYHLCNSLISEVMASTIAFKMEVAAFINPAFIALLTEWADSRRGNCKA